MPISVQDECYHRVYGLSGVSEGVKESKGAEQRVELQPTLHSSSSFSQIGWEVDSGGMGVVDVLIKWTSL